jgi:hypothetical protein
MDGSYYSYAASHMSHMKTQTDDQMGLEGASCDSLEDGRQTTNGGVLLVLDDDDDDDDE